MTETESRPGKYSTAASRWAGVGPYYAMFPTDFAGRVVREYTAQGEVVLDPFAGRGTSVFAAASSGRIGIGIEINPVGWVYGKAKLQTAGREAVEDRIRWLGAKSFSYGPEAAALPEFFHWCFCKRVLKFLIAARQLLDWRYNKTDWTAAALLLVDMHGKINNALSNQMRQTKAMSPQYSIEWWRKREMKPPDIDPVEFMLRKVAWRYAKGATDPTQSRVYMGDSRERLRVIGRQLGSRAKLLFTSPPYHGVTNYFYDQWLRLWLLGGPSQPKSCGTGCKRKFQNRREYVRMLQSVFLRCKPLMARSAIVCVRTDARRFTKDATVEALENAFPLKKLRKQDHSLPVFSQTNLFHSKLETKGEVDFVMW